MTLSCIMSALVALVVSVAGAQETTRQQVVKQAAQQMIDAFMKNDFARVIDLTYPGVVKIMGGRTKAIELAETTIKQAKDQGIEIKTYTVGDPKEFFKQGDETFVVIPTASEATIPGGKIAIKSYLLGVSSDDGKTWKFADGAGLKNKALRDVVFPKLPEGLQLPESAKPEVIKD